MDSIAHPVPVVNRNITRVPVNKIAIDIETYSGDDLKECGVHKYSEHPDFRVLILAYRANREPVKYFDLTRETLPDWFIKILFSPDWIKTAFNAAFEIRCLSVHLGAPLDPAQWRCTMVLSARHGLPMKLETVAATLRLTEQKMEEGRALIALFCEPVKGRRVLPQQHPDKWKVFIEYCKQDVNTEVAVFDRLSAAPLYANEAVERFEQDLWVLDQKINNRGILVDQTLARNALAMFAAHCDTLRAEAVRISGISSLTANNIKMLMLDIDPRDKKNNPAKVVAEKFKAKYKCSIDKAGRDILLARRDLLPVERRLIEIDKIVSKTSVTKFQSMLTRVCRDGRIYGALQFCGARTWRWSGQGVQPQNMPINRSAPISLLRSYVMDEDTEALELVFGNLPTSISELLRTGLVAPPGYKFADSDFAAIEARVLAWLAGEQWRLDVFNTHGKIYEASAAKMFKIVMQAVTKEIRSKGKVSELALGYNGSINALIAMGAYKMGLVRRELRPLVKAWRLENPAICASWKMAEHNFRSAIKYPGEKFTYKIPSGGVLTFQKLGNTLQIMLPSGRPLSYVNARLETVVFNKFLTRDKEVLAEYERGETTEIYEYIAFKPKVRRLNFFVDYDAPVSRVEEIIIYNGVDQDTKQWGDVDTYGGKIIENITQGIARDCLAVALYRLDKKGFYTVLHIHDQILAEVPLEFTDIAGFDAVLSKPIPWAPNLPLKGEGLFTPYYMKEED